MASGSWPREFAEPVAAIYGNAALNGEPIRPDGAIRMQPKQGRSCGRRR